MTAAYQVLRDEGMAESRQGAGTRTVPHRTTPAAVHRANGFFSGLLEDSPVEVRAADSSGRQESAHHLAERDTDRIPGRFRVG